MTNTDIYTNDATEHHGEHHDTTTTDKTSKNDNTSSTGATREERKRSHRGAKKERKTTMKNRIATALTGLAFSLLLTITFTANTPSWGSTSSATDTYTKNTPFCSSSSCDETVTSTGDDTKSLSPTV